MLTLQDAVGLLVNVTELPGSRAHGISDRDAFRCIHTKLNDVVESSVAAGWVIVQCNSARESVRSLLYVQILPDPPYSIDLCVVQEEVRVAG
jgi:hypothetical protein